MTEKKEIKEISKMLFTINELNGTKENCDIIATKIVVGFNYHKQVWHKLKDLMPADNQQVLLVLKNKRFTIATYNIMANTFMDNIGLPLLQSVILAWTDMPVYKGSKT